MAAFLFFSSLIHVVCQPRPNHTTTSRFAALFCFLAGRFSLLRVMESMDHMTSGFMQLFSLKTRGPCMMVGCSVTVPRLSNAVMSHVCVAASAAPARVAWEAPTLYIAEAAWLHAARHGPVCKPACVIWRRWMGSGTVLSLELLLYSLVYRMEWNRSL